MRRLFILIVVFGSLAAGFVGYLLKSEEQARVLIHQQNVDAAELAGGKSIVSSAVTTINGVRVPVGNYLPSDSSFGGDPSIQFMLPEGPLSANVGTTFEVGSKKYVVLNIWEDEYGHGYVSYTEVSSKLPSFELKLEDEDVDGASMWLFAINDGEEDLALSTETNGEIRMARMDTEGERTSEWITVANSKDVGGQKIADHWHVTSGGYHWIVFSVTSAEESYLLKLDKNFERVFLKPVATKGPTNDMFAVADEGSIYIGHFLPGTGHTIYEVDLDGNVVDIKTIGGDEFLHSNGASAVATEDGFTVFAGETMNFLAQSTLMRLDYSIGWFEDWNFTLVDEENTNISMASAVQWGDQWIVTARVRTDATSASSLQVQDESGLQSDGGQIWRFVFDGLGKELSREVLYSGDDANRPHMELKDDLLITTWDTTGHSVLRIESVSLN